MQINFKQFGIKVKNIRRNLLLTQEGVYNKTGISIETQRRIEKGIQEPKISTLEKLSNFYKYDLISLLITCRSNKNFFSQEIISSINVDLIACNYDSLKATISTIINSYIDNAKEKSHPKAKLYLTRYLDTFNKLEFAQYNDIVKNIVNVENFVLFLNNNKKGIGKDAYLYDLEVSSIIYLIALYRQSGKFDMAISLSKETITRLLNYPNLTKIQCNHIGALYLNLAYILHRLDNHNEVITTIDTALNNTKLYFTNHLYNELVIRKAFALYLLNDPLYESLLDAVLLNSTKSHKTTICKVLHNSYGIDHPLC